MDLVFGEVGSEYDRDAFDCGSPPLNDFLKKHARQNQVSGFSRTFIAADRAAPRKILGYYSLSMGQVDFDSLPSGSRKKIPKYPVPVARIGRLAVDKTAQGKDVGRDLLMDAFHRALEAAKSVGVYAVIVDAKDDHAKSFYEVLL